MGIAFSLFWCFGGCFQICSSDLVMLCRCCSCWREGCESISRVFLGVRRLQDSSSHQNRADRNWGLLENISRWFSVSVWKNQNVLPDRWDKIKVIQGSLNLSVFLRDFQQILGSQNGLGWKAPSRPSSVFPCLFLVYPSFSVILVMGRIRTRLPKALPNLFSFKNSWFSWGFFGDMCTVPTALSLLDLGLTAIPCPMFCSLSYFLGKKVFLTVTEDTGVDKMLLYGNSCTPKLGGTFDQSSAWLS